MYGSRIRLFLIERQPFIYLTDERLTGCKRCLCICVSILLALILLGGVIILVVLLVVIGGQPPRVTTNCGQIEGEFDVLHNVFTYKVIASSLVFAFEPVLDMD